MKITPTLYVTSYATGRTRTAGQHRKENYLEEKATEKLAGQRRKPQKLRVRDL